MAKMIPLLIFLLGLAPGFSGLDDLEDINFPLNSSIVVDGFQGLDLLAAVMSRHANLDLEITGHTDSTGSVEYNKRLAARRANSVKTYLVSKGVDEAKIKTEGEGISRDHDNATREGRFQNRRSSLTLYETDGGVRTKVSYRRLLELFFGALTQPQIEALAKNEDVMKKLSELERQHKELRDTLEKKLAEIEKNQAHFKQIEETLPQRIAANLQLTKYSGVSFGAGIENRDDANGRSQSDFTGQIKGLYFRPFGESFAVQAQGDFNYYDLRKEGQVDAGFVYKHEGFRIAAAGSYKWASIDGLETARIGQGALIADWLFDVGKIGLYGTFPFADGDVVSTTPSPTSSAFVVEQYVNVPNQLGLDFGVSIGNKIDLSGYAASLDGVTDADFSAGLKLDVLVKEYLTWYLQADLNDSLLVNRDDSTRFLTGLRFGSWSQARYHVNEEITPVNIPSIRYEILSRNIRRGNSAPVANAGASRTGVPEGPVTLDGSASFDPEGDAITFKWIQTSGPSVDLQAADQAIATFNGRAGEAYAFQLVVRDSFGETGSDAVRIGMEAAPIPAPTIISFIASPPTIEAGGISNLTWATVDASEVTISGIGVVGPSGSVLVSPATTTTYTLTATNVTGSVTATAIVAVVEPPPIPSPVINFFSAIPDEIIEGEFTTLSWSTEFAETVTISGFGEVNASGSLILAPIQTTSYTLTATNEQGSVSADVAVTVNPMAPPPPPNNDPVADAGVDQILRLPANITLDGNGSFDPDGDALTYQWSQVAGKPVTLSGADTPNPSFFAEQGTYTFRLVVSDGRGGTATDEVTITVIQVKARNQ